VHANEPFVRRSYVGSMLLGFLIASHTLLGHPFMHRLGLARDEAVVVTLGGSLLAHLAAPLLLSICVEVFTRGFSFSRLLLQLMEFAVFVPIVLMGLAALGRRFLKWAGDDASRQMLVMVLIVTVTAQGAHAIHLEGIVGAFLAGLAVNAAMQEGHGREQIEPLGNTLFVSAFFVSQGALLNVRELARVIREPGARGRGECRRDRVQAFGGRYRGAPLPLHRRGDTPDVVAHPAASGGARGRSRWVRHGRHPR
jgi:Na+:H+ antiporter